MVVVWILAFLGVVFTSFTFSMRTELAAAGNFREKAETQSLAEAGIYRAAAEIINAERNVPPDSTLYDALDERWHSNPGAYENVPLGRGTYWVTVSDEESKIPLNGATDAVLRRLFAQSGVKEGRVVSVIVDSIQDWRDPDKLHRLNGAEDDHYLSLPVPYKAKNGNFETIDELLLVKGVTPEILYGNVASPDRRAVLEAQPPWERQLGPGEYLGVARHLSVFGAGQVNVNTASAEVLMALGFGGPLGPIASFGPMVTAWATAPEDEHRLLARTLMTFLRYPELPDEALPASLLDQPNPIPLKVAQPDTLDKPSDLWSVLDNQQRPGLVLVVTLAFSPFAPTEQPLTRTAEFGFRQADGASGGMSHGYFSISFNVNSKKPLAGLQVKLLERGDLAVRDPNGEFSIRNLTPGEYTLEITADGHKASRHKIKVPAANYDIEL